VLLTAFFAIGWLIFILLVPSTQFVIFAPSTKISLELFLAVGQLFGAFVLALIPAPHTADRMRWVAGGLFVFGVGTLTYGFLYPLLTDNLDLNILLYSSLLMRTAGILVMVVGLVPAVPPRPRHSVGLILSAVILLAGISVVTLANRLPPLVELPTGATVVPLVEIEQIAHDAQATFPGLTT
jgi:hypothetical protein